MGTGPWLLNSTLHVLARVAALLRETVVLRCFHDCERRFNLWNSLLAGS